MPDGQGMRSGRPRGNDETPFPVCDLAGWDGSPDTLEAEVLAKVRAACSAGEGPPPKCVIADFGFRSVSRAVLKDLLQGLAAGTHPAPVVVTNLHDDVGADALDALLDSLAVQAIPTADGSCGPDNGSPVLFRRPDRRYTWIGPPHGIDWAGTSPLIDLGVLDAELERLDEERERKAGETLTLEMEEYSRRHFQAPPKVCRTPSVELVTCFAGFGWLLNDLDEERKGHGLDLKAGYALARRCRNQLHFLQHPGADQASAGDLSLPIEIVADTVVPPRLIYAFKDCLERMLDTHRTRVEVIRLGPEDLPLFDDYSRIIVFADRIQSESTVRRVVSQVVQARRLPDAVVALVDARREPAAEIVYVTTPIQLVSLTVMKVVVPAEERSPSQIVNIDPKDLREETVAAPADPVWPIGPGRLHDLLAETGALYTGHVSRPNGRHFTFYVDVSRLLGSMTPESQNLGPAGEVVLAECRTAIDEWLGNRNKLDAVCYPWSERPSAPVSIARRLAEAYTPGVGAQLLYTNWRPADLPRIGAFSPGQYDRRLFAGAEDENHPIPFERVVIVDRSSMTGRSIRDLIRLVAREAKELLVLIFLSHGPVEEERLLTSLRNVGSCTVKVKFLARLRIPVFDRANCPHCMQLDRLEVEEYAYPTDFFQEYVLDLRERLAPKDLDSLRTPSKRQPSPEEVRDGLGMLRWREIIERAQSRTIDRHALYERLLGLDRPELSEKEGRERRQLIALLAAEWTLLKRPCLSLPKFKDALARLAVPVISDPTSHDEECRNAIVVLRTASQTEFAEGLPSLLRALSEPDPPRKKLIQQLLYCTYTFLQRDNQVSAALEPIVESLEACVPLTDHLLRNRPQMATRRISRQVRVLHAQAHYQKEKLRFRERRRSDSEPMDAWRTLRACLHLDGPTALQHIPDALGPDFEYLRFARLSEKERREADDRAFWQARLEKWPTSKGIVLKALTLLGSLKDIVDRVQELDPDEKRALLSPDRVAGEMADLESQISSFAESPKEKKVAEQWNRFKQTRNRLGDLLFNMDTIYDQAVIVRRQSALYRLVRTCPTDLTKQLPRSYEGLSLQFSGLAAESSDIRVFCHAGLVEWCLGQALGNVIAHNDSLVAGESIPTELKIETESARTGEEWVVLTISNGGKPKKTAAGATGMGLSLMKDSLMPYGASVGPIKTNEPWRYVVEFRFRKWGV